jgi:flagellar hook-length control protein FliK
VAQFEIARDGRRGASAEASAPAWRARFTLDVEPMGPVHVQIALNHTRAAVTLWAERAASAARLREDAPLLAQALREAELEPGDVLVRTGEPPRSGTAAAGRFLDRAS